MSGKGFVIIRFIETDEVEVTSTTWLREEQTKCYWPPYATSQRQIKSIGSHETPISTWTLHNILVLGQGKSFSKWLKCLFIRFFMPFINFRNLRRGH
jgi:hypothetical protein